MSAPHIAHAPTVATLSCPVGQLLLVVAVQVSRRRHERRVRPAADQHPAFLRCDGLDRRAQLRGHGITRHALSHRHHHVDQSFVVVVDHCVAIDLQVGEGPGLVEYAEADFAVAGNRFGLGPIAHGRYEQVVVVVWDVVDDRHRRAVGFAAVAKYAGPVGLNEQPPLRGQHVAIRGRLERVLGQW
jgi:hypothetical protein